MHYTTIIATALSLSPLLPFTTSLGINCRGSGFCHLASWNNKSPERITQVLRDAVWHSSKPNSTVYNSGDHIICVSQSQSVTLGGSAAAALEGTGLTGTGTGTFSLAGSIGEGGVCLFPQGANLTLGQIRPLTDKVLEHGCKTCGSVPIHFVDQGSNDPKDGILTFNYVDKPYCTGECISDDGTTGQSRLRRSAKLGARV